MKMPVIFVGHGSPTNAIESNVYTAKWHEIGKRFNPKGILMVSGHWFTQGLKIQDEKHPNKINDLYGFPKELYDLVYAVEGDHELTSKVKEALNIDIEVDNHWGIDHGAWSVLVHMYPKADIPVVQLSVDRNRSAREHFELGQQLKKLRDEGYMIIASGNVVHNLSKINWNLTEPYEWAKAFDDKVEELVRISDYDNLVNFRQFGQNADYSVPTPDHYYPLLYALGASAETDTLEVFNKDFDYGSLSMTSYMFF